MEQHLAITVTIMCDLLKYNKAGIVLYCLSLMNTAGRSIVQKHLC